MQTGLEWERGGGFLTARPIINSLNKGKGGQRNISKKEIKNLF